MQAQDALDQALAACNMAARQSEANDLRAAELRHMLQDLVGCCERHADYVRAKAAQVSGHQWDQMEAIREALTPLEARIADIRRLL